METHITMPKTNYSNFSFNDFLEDDYFIQWVVAPTTEHENFWKAFMIRHPEKLDAIRQASTFITTFSKQKHFTNDNAKAELWLRISNTVKQQNVHTVEVRPLYSLPYMKVAAAITLLIVCSAIFWLMSDRHNVVTTAYNEVTTIKLPDHSIVTLNGNSTLKYDEDWEESSPREVWIEGEAYFNITHLNRDPSNIKPNHQFIVHSNSLNIEVLGTSFNVRNRNDQTNITLLTGKVKVKLGNETKTSAEDLIMLPGDYAEYTDKMLVTRKKLPNPQQATAWTKQEFNFTNPYLKDILKVLTESHGYMIDVKEPDLLELKIEGEITVTTIEELLQTVSAVLDLQVTETGHKHLTVSRK